MATGFADQILRFKIYSTRILAKLSKWLTQCKRREVSLPVNILKIADTDVNVEKLSKHLSL
jgi:hypothetical protein